MPHIKDIFTNSAPPLRIGDLVRLPVDTAVPEGLVGRRAEVLLLDEIAEELPAFSAAVRKYREENPDGPRIVHLGDTTSDSSIADKWLEHELATGLDKELNPGRFDHLRPFFDEE